MFHLHIQITYDLSLINQTQNLTAGRFPTVMQVEKWNKNKFSRRYFSFVQMFAT